MDGYDTLVDQDIIENQIEEKNTTLIHYQYKDLKNKKSPQKTK